MGNPGLLPRALLAGLLLGLGGRALMRVLALAAGMTPGFSIGGSLEVIATGLLLGTPVAAGYFFLRRRLGITSPLAGPGTALLGLLVLAVVPPPSARSAMLSTPLPGWKVLAAYGVLFLFWGMLLELLGPRGEENHRERPTVT